MKKILFSMMTLVLVIGLVGAGAFAVFSDTETSTGNTFTAGTLDLNFLVDGTYTGASSNFVVTPGGNGLNGKVEFGTDEGIKPGDSGTITWSLTNDGSLTGKLTVAATVTEAGNGSNEPECLDEGGTWPSSCPDTADLGDAMVCTITKGGTPLISDVSLGTAVAALNGDTATMGSSDTLDYVLSWSIPIGVDNKIQSDSAVLDITFTLVQS